jgi:pheromone shutdown protein TraB
MYKFRESIMIQNVKLILEKLSSKNRKGTNIVLVVGKAHYYGINQLWNQYNVGNIRFSNMGKGDGESLILSDVFDEGSFIGGEIESRKQFE